MESQPGRNEQTPENTRLDWLLGVAGAARLAIVWLNDAPAELVATAAGTEPERCERRMIDRSAKDDAPVIGLQNFYASV